LFHGTVDACPIYTRPVVQCVVMHAATQVVLVHNHPSGESEPSRADLGVTARIRRALEPIELRVVDHLIVGKAMVSRSMSEDCSHDDAILRRIRTNIRVARDKNGGKICVSNS
jgi:DNA repair protein RadC